MNQTATTTTPDRTVKVTPFAASPRQDMAEGVGDASILDPSDRFLRRHIGPSPVDVQQMLEVLGYASLVDLIDAAIPARLRASAPLSLGAPQGERQALLQLRETAEKNQIWRSFLGLGYHNCITPPVIQRNILENPGWYTQYTPYQAELAQGRLEALLNFQTLICDLTGLPLANASLLDEATAAAEAMAMCTALAERSAGGKAAGPARRFFVAEDCHPQTIAVVQSRARSMGIELVVDSVDAIGTHRGNLFGILLQYPTTDGRIVDYRPVIQNAHDDGALVVMAADLLALTLIVPPGELGADIAVGTTQRFGVPLGGGGPHAAYLSTKSEFARKMPGRLVGTSRDAMGRPAYRLAIQTREQHIKRDRATSNICTAQVLLAIMASMYAVYHGPEGLRRIARRVHGLTTVLAEGLRAQGHSVGDAPFFDTPAGARRFGPRGRRARARRPSAGSTSARIPTDPWASLSTRPTTREDVLDVLSCFSVSALRRSIWTRCWKRARRSSLPRWSGRATSSRSRSSTSITARPSCCAT